MSKHTELKPYILVVEDEEPISLLVQYNLEKAGFDVRVEEDGQSGLLAMQERAPDLTLLDWMLPEVSGIDILSRMREDDALRAVPVIMLTARGEESDKLLGLDSGADDYIVKPFSPKELISRIHAVLRRTRPVFETETVSFEGVEVDVNRHSITYQDHDIHLGPTEFRLLMYFMEHPGRTFTREHLLNVVWGTDVYVEERTVDVHIRRVRKALGKANPRLEDLIQTVRGAGYMLDKISV